MSLNHCAVSRSLVCGCDLSGHTYLLFAPVCNNSINTGYMYYNMTNKDYKGLLKHNLNQSYNLHLKTL